MAKTERLPKVRDKGRKMGKKRKKKAGEKEQRTDGKISRWQERLAMRVLVTSSLHLLRTESFHINIFVLPMQKQPVTTQCLNWPRVNSTQRKTQENLKEGSLFINRNRHSGTPRDASLREHAYISHVISQA